IGKIGSSKVGESSSLDNINIVGVDPISVERVQEGDMTVFYISYTPYAPATVSMSVNPSSVEVGTMFNATYTGNWTKGSASINSIKVDGVDINQAVKPYTLTINGLSFSNKGTYGNKTITLTDSRNNTVTASANIKVNYRYYIGTKP